MATYTENLNLAKPDVNDQVDIQVLNENFDKLDEVVSSGEIYSEEEEVVIGKWIDGRPIYRQILTAKNVQLPQSIGTMPNSLTIVGKVDVSTLVNARVILVSNNRKVVPYGQIAVRETDQVWVFPGDVWTASTDRTIYVIYEYTKTTDPPQ